MPGLFRAGQHPARSDGELEGAAATGEGGEEVHRRVEDAWIEHVRGYGVVYLGDVAGPHG